MNARRLVCVLIGFANGTGDGHKWTKGTIVENALATGGIETWAWFGCQRCGRTTEILEGSTIWQEWRRGIWP